MLLREILYQSINDYKFYQSIFRVINNVILHFRSDLSIKKDAVWSGLKKHLNFDCFYFNRATTLDPKKRKICFLIQILLILNNLVVNTVGSKFVMVQFSFKML